MNRATPPILFIGLVAAAPAFAQSTPWITDTYATVGGIITNRSGRDFSKIEEYQDLRDGVLSNVWSRGRDDRTWYQFYGENFGRDDQYINLDGGQYSRFRYNLYTNWIPHNFLYNGATPFYMDREREGEPSRWVTLRALRVLRWADEPTG